MDASSPAYEKERVHQWRPPCSCGVELGEVKEVHNWRPPCSCGVSLDEVATD